MTTEKKSTRPVIPTALTQSKSMDTPQNQLTDEQNDCIRAGLRLLYMAERVRGKDKADARDEARRGLVGAFERWNAFDGRGHLVLPCSWGRRGDSYISDCIKAMPFPDVGSQ